MPWTERHCDLNYQNGICGIIRGCDHVEVDCDGTTIYGD